MLDKHLAKESATLYTILMFFRHFDIVSARCFSDVGLYDLDVELDLLTLDFAYTSHSVVFIHHSEVGILV